MAKPIVEKFAREIRDGMCKHYNYIIEDFRSIEETCIPWGLFKNNEKLVFMKLDSCIFNENFENDICLKINCIREELIKVILITEDINNIGNLQGNFIIIDLINEKIQISDNKFTNTANEIASIMDSNKKMKINGENNKVTYILIGINIIMFIISAILSGHIMDMDTDVLISLGAKYNPAIADGQWFRLVTCMFLHGGLLHIAANMYSLYSIGPLVENLYGRYKFMAMYFVSGIIASLGSFLFSSYVSVGASGAIFGLLGVVMVFAVKERKRVGKDFLINIASVIAINLYIGLSMQGIDNFAHLGGLISGVILGVIFKLDKK